MDKDKSTDFHREKEIGICKNPDFKICLENRVSSYFPNDSGITSLPVIGAITEKAVYGKSVCTVYESRESW